MRNYIIVLYISMVLLVCLSSIVNCGPLDTTHDEFIKHMNKLDFKNSDELSTNKVRMPRFTCDIFSAEFEGISVASGLCLAKCLGQRYLGGKCEDGICKCSQRTF